MSNFSDAARRLVAAESDRQRNECYLEHADLTLYSGPLLAKDQDWLSKLHPGFMSNPTLKAMVDLIVRKAETESGEKAFTVADKPQLLRLPAEVISMIAEKLFSLGEIDQETVGND